MVQKTVLKVDLSCLKCKRKLLKAVSSIEGVDKVEVDSTKGTLSVTGNADPYKIIVSARKATGGRHVDVVSVGPPPPPAKPAEAQKKPDDKNSGAGESGSKKGEYHNKKGLEEALSFHDPLTWQCQRLVFGHSDRVWNDGPHHDNSSCSIV